ncbi:unnamed protein product [Ectocarpus sp. CCAP 1310/34]|nr:unnamed protein product [Ectocarpus sp. CCAP 1310/34]
MSRTQRTAALTVTKLVLKDSMETRILALQKKQAAEGSASAAVGVPSSDGQRRASLSIPQSVAGNIARDNAKDLKIGEYNALFGVSEGAGDSFGGDSKPHTTSSNP